MTMKVVGLTSGTKRGLKLSRSKNRAPMPQWPFGALSFQEGH